jgi:hypothetical protein
MFTRYFIVVALTGLLAGCVHDPCCVARVSRASEASSIEREAVTADSVVVAGTPIRFLAVGYGSQNNYLQYNRSQQRLMAIRAAQIDAYRNLAEQVHGFRVWGNTAVSAFVAQNDNVRTYVDAFVRGARVINMNNVGDGTFEVTVESTLPVDFVECVRRTLGCAASPAEAASAEAASAEAALPPVVTLPVVAPSVVYTSP